MYNASIHAQQVLGATILAFSLTETTEEGISYPVATAMSSSDLLSSADEDPLWVFLEQIKESLSRVLGDSQNIYRQAIEHDRIDGGWGGAGQTGQPEQSEDR